MQSRLLLDIVVGQGTSIFELLSSEDQTLLIWRNTLLVLDLGLNIVDSVRWLDIEGDGLSSQGLDEDLHTSTKTENQVKSRLLLDIVVGQGTSILKLLSSKDQTLLIWRNTFLILNLGLNVVNGVGWFDIEGDGLSSQGLDKDLHTSTKTENQMQSRLLLDIVVGQGTSIFELLSSKDQTLLIWRNTFLILTH